MFGNADLVVIPEEKRGNQWIYREDPNTLVMTGSIGGSQDIRKLKFTNPQASLLNDKANEENHEDPAADPPANADHSSNKNSHHDAVAAHDSEMLSRSVAGKGKNQQAEGVDGRVDLSEEATDRELREVLREELESLLRVLKEQGEISPDLTPIVKE
jgi:hypothetical protein